MNHIIDIDRTVYFTYNSKEHTKKGTLNMNPTENRKGNPIALLPSVPVLSAPAGCLLACVHRCGRHPEKEVKNERGCLKTLL